MTETLADLAARLYDFGCRRIAADRYPDDVHSFRWLACPKCGPGPVTPTIEHHTGSRPGNFRGTISGQCATCGETHMLFSFTGAHRTPTQRETPRCSCGSNQFLIAEVERIERSDEGVPGFFDEGVVVGHCTVCGRERVLVETD